MLEPLNPNSIWIHQLHYQNYTLRITGSPSSPKWLTCDVRRLLPISTDFSDLKNLRLIQETCYVPQGASGKSCKKVKCISTESLLLILRFYNQRYPGHGIEKFARWVAEVAIPELEALSCADKAKKVPHNAPNSVKLHLVSTQKLPQEQPNSDSAPTWWEKTFEGHGIRITGTPEQLMWVAQDVCNALGIKNARDVLLKRIKPQEKGVALIYTPGGVQEMLTVTEPGLYRLIFRSDKPAAERFQNWVFHEVLPSIRRTGQYSISPPDEAWQMLMTLLENRVTELQGQLETVEAELDKTTSKLQIATSIPDNYRKLKRKFLEDSYLFFARIATNCSAMASEDLSAICNSPMCAFIAQHLDEQVALAAFQEPDFPFEQLINLLLNCSPYLLQNYYYKHSWFKNEAQWQEFCHSYRANIVAKTKANHCSI
ncbi:MAG: BRO family protein (plasmid) [Phormidium sp.]